MGSLLEFREVLKIRYQHLYGKGDYEEKVRKEEQKLMAGIIITVLIFVILTGNDIASARAEYSNVIFNDKGEITGALRPQEGGESYSFTAKAEVAVDGKILEKEYYITVRPLDEAVSEVETADNVPASEKAEAELKSMISGLNDTGDEERIILPDQLESGTDVTWQKVENTDPVMYLLGGIVVVFLIYRNRFYGINRKEKEAKESIIKELPEFINKLVLLLNAGVILNTAFLKVADDCDGKRRSESYFYMRICDIGQMVRDTNASFHQELYDFARHSGVKELMRITNIMMDNVSKGDDLSNKLKRENELLWFARKQQAEEKGKLAETKLTMPLMMLLGVLIMITIAPALMEM